MQTYEASAKKRAKQSAKKRAKEQESIRRKVESAAVVAGKKAQAERSGDVPYTSQLYLEAQRMLCRGLFRYFISLRGLRLLASPSLPFGTTKECFAQRFQPLQRIPHPGLISFASFANARKLQKTSVSVLLKVRSSRLVSCARRIHHRASEGLALTAPRLSPPPVCASPQRTRSASPQK